jgi:hypothetical protein
MIFDRSKHYVAYCNDCDWFQVVGRAPFHGQSKMVKHAKAKPGHATSLLEVETLTAVTSRRFDAIPQVKDTPPPF